MKKLALFFMAFLFLANAYASNEKLYVLRSGSFWEENPVNIDPANPCQEFNFKVTYTVPAGYSVERFDWYVNNVFLRSTNDVTGGYGGTVIKLTAPSITVVCKVVYRNGSTLSAPTPSDEYRLDAKLNPYTMSGPQTIDVGSQTVTYTLNKTESGDWYYSVPLSSVSLNWEYPAAWTLVSTNGLSATFTTDGYTGGRVKGNFTFNGCGFTEGPWKDVTRNYPAVSFTYPYGENVCYNNPTGTFTINPQPAAVSYTYTIHPSYGSDISGATFAGAGTQTLTTTAASATINFNTSSNLIIELGVKANYGNGSSGPEIKKTIGFLYMLEWPSQDINVTYTPITSGPCYGEIYIEAPFVSGATYYYYLDGFMMDQGSGMYMTGFEYRGESVLTIVASNSCASTTTLYKDLNFCSGWGAKASDVNVSLYPNPTINDVTLTVKETGNNTSGKTGKGLKEIKEVKLLDKFGSVKKITKYPAGTKNVRLSLGTLPSDVYIVEISDGVNKVIKRVSKSK